MKKLMILLSIIPIIFSGCWDQRIFEKTGFSLMIGIESSKKEGEYMITATQPAIGAKEKYGVEIQTTVAGGLRESKENRNRMAARIPEPGKIQQVLFSEDAAKKGINELLDTLNRDPENPVLAWVIVTEGSPLEMINKSSKFTDIPGPALYINQLIKNNIKDANTPETRVYNFNIDYFAPGIDPVAPTIKLLEKDILVTGSAVFSGDKMVGKLDHRQTGLLIGMMDEGKDKEYSYIAPYPHGIEMPGRKNFAVTLIESKRSINVSMKDSRPSVDIYLKYEGSLQEFGWDNLDKITVQKKIEDHLNSLLKKDCAEVIKYLQRVGSDPIGIGEIVKAKYYGYWNTIDWKSIYRDIPVNIYVSVKLKEAGAIS